MKLAEHIHNNPWSGTQVVGFFKDKDINNDDEFDNHKFSNNIPCLGDIEALKRYTENNIIDIIYVALNGNDEKALHKLVKAVENLPTQIHYVPNLFFLDMVIGGEIVFFDQRPIIILKNHTNTGHIWFHQTTFGHYLVFVQPDIDAASIHCNSRIH